MTMKSLVLTCISVAGFMLGPNHAYAYNYHLDKEIANLVSQGAVLSRKYQDARQGMRDVQKQRADLDETKHALVAEQASYDKTADNHQQRIIKQNGAIKEVNRECNDQDIGANTSGHVNWCDNKIKTIGSNTKAIASEDEKIKSQDQVLASKTADFDKKVQIWNHDQMLAVSLFNNYSARLNDWLNKAYAFMNTPDFQNNIAWAHASKRCAAEPAGRNADPEQALADESSHALGCLQYVEHARKAYYKKTP